jgi:Phosphotransferase system, mannose/fructose/N-acetylgalactosamine-specific component IIC
MSITQALLIALVVLILEWAESWFAYPMVNTPLILCPIVGLIMGDLNVGIIAGATLQLVFMGAMGIGGTLPADSTLGSVVGTALAISMGRSVEVVLTFAVPIAALGSFLTLLVYIIHGFFNPMVERFCEKGNTRGIEILHFLIAFLSGVPKAVITFSALVLGSGPAEKLVAMLPEYVSHGLNYATDLIPAVGIALLLRMMWSRRMAVFYFAGFLLAAYLKMPIMGVAAFGIVVAVVIALEERGTRIDGPIAANKAEEELFND